MTFPDEDDLRRLISNAVQTTLYGSPREEKPRYVAIDPPLDIEPHRTYVAVFDGEAWKILPASDDHA